VPKDIILLNLSAGDSIVGFNPFKRAGTGSVSVQVDGRISATMHAWDVKDTNETPTLERTLRLIYTVMLDQNLGLGQVHHLIDSERHQLRERLIEALQNRSPLIASEWRELQNLKDKDFRAEVLSAKNKLFRFLTSLPLIRFMGLPDRTLDLKSIMDAGKVLLVNLAPSDDLSEQNAAVFGALLVNEFFECARRRQKDSRGRDPKPYYLYMDEFQNFVSLDIVKMLAQVRKFGLFLVLAHQYLEQMDEGLRAAVLTNCQIKSVFGGLTTPSARMMAEELFIRKLDAKKVKVAIYQTKFWPKEETRQVRTHSISHAVTSGWTETSGSTSSTAHSAGEFFGADQWFSSPTSFGRSTSDSSGSTFTSGDGSSGSESSGESESVADIPVFVPVPFQELSSVQYYTIDEQLTEFTAALKEQYARHCFIKLPGEDAEPMLVPNVEQFYIAEKHLLAYKEKVFSKNNALPAPEVDRLLIEQETAFVEAARSGFGASRPADSTVREPADSEAFDLVGASPIWNRSPSPPAIPAVGPIIGTAVPPTASRKRGPKPDHVNHAKVATLISGYGENWNTDDNLAEICDELDRQGVPAPKRWLMRREGPARSWTRGRQIYPNLVIKAIKHHCKAASGHA
jgi:hypothetical protein